MVAVWDVRSGKPMKVFTTDRVVHCLVGCRGVGVGQPVTPAGGCMRIRGIGLYQDLPRCVIHVTSKNV